MTRPGGGGWRCKYGTWHGLSESCKCPPSKAIHLDPVPAAFPTDVFPARPGLTVRYSVDEQFRVDLEAVLNSPAETVVRRPSYAKEYSL